MDQTITDRFGREVAQPGPEAQAARDAVAKAAQATRHGVMSLDLRDAQHLAHLIEALGGADQLTRFFPTTREIIENTRRAHETQGGPTPITLLELADPPLDQWSPYVNLCYCSLAPDGVTVLAEGIATLPGDATAMTLNLSLVDNVSGATLANVTLPQQFNSSTQEINASGTLPDPNNVDVTATLTAQILPQGADVAVPVVASLRLTGANYVQSISVQNPNHNNHPTRDYIKVALNRTQQQQPDCDYWYEFGTDGSQPVVGLLVNGSATLINGITVAGSPNFSGSCVLQRRSGVGDGATLAFPADQIPGLCTGAGQTVTWNIGPDWFKGAPWDQNQTIDLDFLLNFAVTPGGSTFIRVTSLPSVIGANPPSNIGVVAPMMFVWGCVAAGTPVLMADGEWRAIEQIRAGDRVRGVADEVLEVRETWTGRETQPLIQLGLVDGRSILLTEEHPVLTPDGVRLARDLAAGDTVSMLDGEATLAEVGRAAFDGAVHNLDLAPEGVATDALGDDLVTGFIAAGFAIGDNRMQGVHAALAAQAKGDRDPLEILPAHWRLDVINARRLADGRALLEAYDPLD